MSYVNKPSKPMAIYTYIFRHHAEVVFKYGGGVSDSNFKSVKELQPLIVTDWFKSMNCNYHDAMPTKAHITFWGFNVMYLLVPKALSAEEKEQLKQLESCNYEQKLKLCQTMVKKGLRAAATPTDFLVLARPATNVYLSILHLKDGESPPNLTTYNSVNVRWRKVHKKLRIKFYHYFKPRMVTSIPGCIDKSKDNPLGALEEMCCATHKQYLYYNKFADYYIGINENTPEPENTSDVVIEKYVTCNVTVKYFVCCSKRTYNTNCG